MQTPAEHNPTCIPTVSSSLDESETRTLPHMGISPAEVGWAVADDQLWCESLHLRGMFQHPLPISQRSYNGTGMTHFNCTTNCS
jgi:hypothetical protein